MGTSLRLLLVLAVGLWASPAVRAEPTGTTPEAVRPPMELGPDVPRGAMARFLTACSEGQYALAAEYLNLRLVPKGMRAQKGPELARQLETVLYRALYLDVYRLSDQPEGYPDDRLPALRDSLGPIKTSAGTVEVVIERVPQAGAAPVWKVSANTVAAIPTLFAEYGWGPLADVLPAPFFELRFLHIRLWQWIGLALLLTAAWLVPWLLRRLVVRLTRRALDTGRSALDSGFAESVARPLRLLIGLVVFAAGLRPLALALSVNQFLAATLKALAIVPITWLGLCVLDAAMGRFERRLDHVRHARAVATVPLGRRTLKVFIALIAFIAALQNFGFNVTGLLAGVGVGGLVLALAAQKTLENLFGSVSLVADEPVRVGDVCRFGDTVGTVEDIGLRSTRVRTVDRTLVTVPNAHFSTLALENLSRRDRIPVRATVTLPQGTNAEQVRRVIGTLREMLVAQPKVVVDSVRARFVRMGPQTLEIEVFAYVLTTRWEEFVEIREQIFLGALEVVAAGGVAIK
jgi:MscS family membrane protein